MKKIIYIIVTVIAVCTAGCSINNENMGGQKNTKININKEASKNKNKQEYYMQYNGDYCDFMKLNPNSFMTQDIKWKSKEKSEKLKMVSWKGSKGEYCTMREKGELLYTTKKYDSSYSWLFSDDMFDDGSNKFIGNDLEKWHKKEEKTTKKQDDKKTELEKNNAENKIEEITKKLNISLENTTSWYLDKNSLVKLGRNFMSDKEYIEYLKSGEKAFKRKYSEKDEVVLVTADIKIAENTMYSREYDIGKLSYLGSFVHALVKDGKIVWLDICGAVNDKKISGEKKKVIKEKDAEKKVLEKYDGVLAEGDIKCTGRGVKYIVAGESGKNSNGNNGNKENKNGKENKNSVNIADNNGENSVNKNDSSKYKITPVYVFYIDYKAGMAKGEKQKESIEVAERVLIDAYTGEFVG